VDVLSLVQLKGARRRLPGAREALALLLAAPVLVASAQSETQARLATAQRLFEAGQFKGAESAWADVVKADPGLFEAVRGLGTIAVNNSDEVKRVDSLQLGDFTIKNVPCWRRDSASASADSSRVRSSGPTP
jgi:hypothetical protein